MKLNNYERYEIQAEAFRIMTGHMAPGKDASMHSYPAPYEERMAAWVEWSALNIDLVHAMLTATERIINRDEDYEWPERECMRRALHDIAEEWAGAECGEPVYAQEAYAIELAKRMYALAVKGLAPNAM